MLYQVKPELGYFNKPDSEIYFYTTRLSWK